MSVPTLEPVRETTRPARQINVAPPPVGLRYDLTRFRLLRTLLRKRWFQFMLVLPNQAIFWLVIVAGVVGRQIAPANIATAITWYLWFCIVFVLMVGVGRGWCAMCPFGGAGEWLQRKSLFKRKDGSVGLGLKYPERLAKYGLLPAVGIFLLMTFVEEYFNVAGPGAPLDTALLVAFILVFSGTTFLVFERRVFCRYLCPLSGLIGTVGQMGAVAGFRAKDRNVCLTCETKECMRGSERGYGCPWYEYPGQQSANAFCGLCSECYKNCSKDNIGLFVQPPLTSLYSNVKRRMDVAVGIALLAGLVWFQQLNAMTWYGNLEARVNSLIGWPHYPNPILYLFFCLIPLPVLYGLGRATAAGSRLSTGGRMGWRRLFVDWAYILIPVVGMDYLARQLPKFFDHVLRLVAVVSDPLGLGWNLFGTAHLKVANDALTSQNGTVIAQIVVVLLGLAGSLYAAWRIRQHTAEYAGLTAAARRVQGALIALSVLAVAGMQVWWYVLMKAAE